MPYSPRPSSANQTVPITLTYNANITPNMVDGSYRKVTMTGNAILHPPINATDGMKWKARFIASGADRNLVFDSAILIPSGFTLTDATRTIASGKIWIVQLEHNGTAWMLQALEGGY